MAPTSELGTIDSFALRNATGHYPYHARINFPIICFSKTPVRHSYGLIARSSLNHLTMPGVPLCEALKPRRS
jgi:hypothetical protein